MPITTTCIYAKELPPIETVAASSFTSTDGESDQPYNEKDCGHNPQHMQGEPHSKEEQDE